MAYRDLGVPVPPLGQGRQPGGDGRSQVYILPELQSFPMTQADTKLGQRNE